MKVGDAVLMTHWTFLFISHFSEANKTHTHITKLQNGTNQSITLRSMVNFHQSDSLNLVAHEVKDLAHHIHPAVPNPAPLGLIAFGLTTALLQIKHTRLGGDDPDDLNGVDSIVLGFAMFFGGFLQVVAGLDERKRNNLFGYTAFLIFGGFWMSVGTVEIISLLAPNAAPVNKEALQTMLVLMGTFTTIMWVCTFKMNKTINLLFFLLATTLYLLAVGVKSDTADKVAGYFGLATAATAYWLAGAELVNDIIGESKEIIPLGHWKHNDVRNAGVMHMPGRIHGAIFQSILRSQNRENDDDSMKHVESIEETV